MLNVFTMVENFFPAKNLSHAEISKTFYQIKEFYDSTVKKTPRFIRVLDFRMTSLAEDI